MSRDNGGWKMNTDFQVQFAKSILLFTPGLLLLGVLGVLGLLMMLERVGLLGSQPPPAAEKPASPTTSEAPPTDTPA